MDVIEFGIQNLDLRYNLHTQTAIGLYFEIRRIPELLRIAGLYENRV